MESEKMESGGSGAVKIGIRRINGAVDVALPAYQTAGASGLDVHAATANDLVIAPGAIQMIPCGFAMEIPAGYEAQVRPRSGLATKHAITLPNSPATIDSDYRGELRVALINLGKVEFTVSPGMRIAQLVFAPVTRIEWAHLEELSSTGRGSGGFGHTGEGS
jgi:dUTP pyrophosphatase